MPFNDAFWVRKLTKIDSKIQKQMQKTKFKTVKIIVNHLTVLKLQFPTTCCPCINNFTFSFTIQRLNSFHSLFNKNCNVSHIFFLPFNSHNTRMLFRKEILPFLSPIWLHTMNYIISNKKTARLSQTDDSASHNFPIKPVRSRRKIRRMKIT